MKTEIKIEVEFTEPLLATIPGKKEIVEEFISDKAPNQKAMEEEIASVAEQLEGVSTVFSRYEDGKGKPHLWDFQIKGYIKERTMALIELGEAPKELNRYNYKKSVNQFVHVFPRRIPLNGEVQTATTFFERSMRVETLRGERVCLARSECAPIGTKIQFNVVLFTGPAKRIAQVDEDFLVKIMDLGQYIGLGQWRSGSYGRFNWRKLEA